MAGFSVRMSYVGLGMLFPLMVSLSALAGYTPPQNPSAPKTSGTTTGVRRGCLKNSTDSTLTAIAPQSHVGQSSSLHPTFVWFVPDTKSYQMEFELYERHQTGPQNIFRQQLSSQLGWMKLKLPEDAVALSPSKQYFWQIILYCNPNRPSSALIASAELQLQNSPRSLSAQLNEVTDPLKIAEIFASNGFWYDALALLMSEESSEFRQARFSLLRDLGVFEEAEYQQQLNAVIGFE